MAVYSYTTSTKDRVISAYASDLISTYASYVVSEFKDRENNLFKLKSSSSQLEEKTTYSFNPSSYSLFSTEDYGFISESFIEQDDFGQISNLHSDTLSYGKITTVDDKKGYPYGSIKNIISNTTTIFNLKTIGGIQFTLQGGSLSSFGSPYIGYGINAISGEGVGKQVFSPLPGSGNIFSFISSAESFGPNPPESISLYKLIGSGIEKNTESYVGSGSIFEFVTKTESFGPNPPESIALFEFSGAATDIKNTESYVGSGSLRINTFTEESQSFSPKTLITIKLSGLGIQKNTESYVGSGSLFGFISKTESVGVNPPESTALFKFTGTAVEKNRESYVGKGKISTFTGSTNSKTFSPETSGRIRIRGSAIQKNTESYVGSGSLFSFVSKTESTGVNPPESTALFKFTGTAVEKNTESYVGSGSLFGFGGKLESVTFSYNESAQVSYIVIDNGFITQQPLSEEDYGLVSESEFFIENEDYGKVNFDLQEPVYGSSFVTGKAKPEFSLRVFGTGSLFGLSSSTESFGPNPPESIQLFNIEGSAIEKNTESYYGVSTALTFSSSITLIYSISTFGGGRIRLSNSLVEKNTESYVGSGSLFGFSGSSESTGVNPPESTALFKFVGSAAESTTPATEVGSGSLFSFGGKVERVTFNYNQSAESSAFAEDYGNVSDPHTISDDYGLITELPFSRTREDYGIISSVTKKPYGLFKFSNELIESSTGFHVGSGTVSIYISSITPLALRLPEFNVQLRFSGAATNLKNTESYVGSGSLFGLSSATESRAFSPETSVLFSVSGSAIEKNAESYVGTGTLFGLSSAAESRVFSPETSVLFTFSGAAVEKNTESYVGSGSLFTFVSKTETVAFSPEVSTLFSISGNAVEKNTESYVGTGSLFGFSSTTESRTFSPETSALFTFSGAATESITPATEIGSGTIFTFVSKSESFGANPPESIELFKFSGAATDIKNTESYVGTGSLFGFSSTTESRTFSPETSVLFTFSGAATESTTPATEIGSGLIKISESVAKLDSKNKIRLISAYESKTNRPRTKGCDLKFYGSVFLYFEYRETGSGRFKLDGRATIQTNPVHIGFGKIQTGGNAFPFSYTLSEIGSGSLFSFISKTESAGVNPPESTALFKFTGAATNVKNTEAYLGTGRATLSGKTFSVFKLRHIGSGTENISGNGLEKNTESYVGSGSLFSFVSKTESTGVNPPESTALFKFSGAATDIKNTESYVGSGSLFGFVSKTETVAYSPEASTLFKISGRLQESYSPAPHFGSGSLFAFSSTTESVGVNPPESTALFKFTGTAAEKNRESYVGTGSLFTFVSKTETVVFSPETSVLFTVSGSAIEKNTEAYAGTGTLFNFSSTTDSFSINPQESTALFRFSGSSTESITPATEIGSGSLFTFVSKTETVVFSPETSALFSVSGNAIERNTEAYSGTGTLFGLSSTTISREINVVSSGLFKVSGAAAESTTPATEIGSGSLFTFASKTESRAFSPETSVLFSISGSAIEKNAESYVGLGSLFGLNSSTFAFQVRYQVQQRLFRIFGIKQEAFAKGNYDASAQVTFTGISKNQKINYVPPKPSRIYII